MADVATWTALGVAIYAAGVSTYNEFTKRRDSKRALERNVHVEGRMRHKGGDVTHPVRVVTAVNTQRRPIEIARVGAVLASGVQVWRPTADDLPARLGDGESVELELPDNWLDLVGGSLQSEIVAYSVADSNGAVYESERLGGVPQDSDA